MIKCLGRCWKRTENSHRKSETCFQGIHSLFIYQQIHSFNINSFIHFFFLFFYFYFYFSYLQFLSKCPFQSIFFFIFLLSFISFLFRYFRIHLKTQVGGGILGWKGKYDINYQGYPIFYTFHLRKSFIFPISTYFPSFNIFS